MIKFNNKRDVDRHVSQMCQKLNENERSSKGFAIAKSYAKVSEHELAKDWLQRYLDIKPDDAAAHKLMGEIYERLQKPDQAITSFQRSFNINSKQNDIIKHVCRLFLLDEGWSASPGKAKYWCELAETQNIRDDNVFNLRLKMASKDKKHDKPVEEMILREIASRPHDVGIRIRLVKFLLEEKRLNDAFKYCFDLEMKFMEIFLSSIEWYATVSSVLSQNNADSWNYWCLLLIALEKQIYLNLKKDLSLQAIKQNNIREVTNLIFEYDQVLKKANDAILLLAPVKDLANELINHFRGNMALHIASLLFQKQKIANNDQWKETTKKCLPFLIFAFQCSTVNTEAAWLKNTNDVIRNLFTHLKKEGAFRCAQAARTIISCKVKESDVIQGSNQKFWFTIDDIFNQVRETSADLNWRKNMYRILFANADQQMKISTSYFVQNSFFQEPRYETISFNDVENYENIAQHLYPSSLDHYVYLGLGRKDLHTYKAHTFKDLNLSSSNLINCNPETINKIDIDSFLYCAIIQAKRKLEAEKFSYEMFNNRLNERPLILPASNIVEGLCTEEQNDWWLSAFKIYKNISGDNLAQLKATLQFGIEAVRGVDETKVDLIILLKLGDLLLTRANYCGKVDDKRHFELRVEYIYKFAMKMMRNREQGGTRRLFKFATNNYDIEQEIDQMAGEAIGYLSKIYFQKEEYKEFIDDFVGIRNVWAHFLRAEAYKKLDESGKTPKKTKMLYMEKSRESLIETLALLDKNEHFDKKNPLRMRVEKDLRKLQYDLSSSFNEEFDFHNESELQNGYVEDEIFHNASSSSFRGRRDISFAVKSMPNYNEKFTEVEALIRKLNDLVVSVKDDVLCVRNDITSLKDDMLNIRGDITDLNVNKDAITSKALNDIYKSIEDLTWNVTYMMNVVPNSAAGPILQQQRFPTTPQQQMTTNQFSQMYNTAYPIYPMQYSASRPSLPNQIPTHLQYADQLGVNLMMNATSFNNPVIPPSPQQNVLNAQPKSSLLEALNTPTVLNTWNNTYNSMLPTIPPSIQPNIIASPNHPIAQSVIQNKPIEKDPPINVVITSSDPLPTQNTITIQPTLSVTIPPQHIKHSIQMQSIVTPITNQSILQYQEVSPSKHDTSEYYEETADYDPRPDFKPIIPLPAEIEVKTGEENEQVLFEERGKLFRFVEKEWKERGIGNMKILKNMETKKCRIVMRREQIHKLCANHTITEEMDLNSTQNETSLMWGANDYSEEEMKLEKFLIRFKNPDQARKFKDVFEQAKKLAKESPFSDISKDDNSKVTRLLKTNPVSLNKELPVKPMGFSLGGFTGNLSSTPENKIVAKEKDDKNKPAQPSPFANFTFGGSSNKSFTELFSSLHSTPDPNSMPNQKTSETDIAAIKNDEENDNFEPTALFEPVIALPALVDCRSGEEDENIMFSNRAKLLRFDSDNKEWKERGIGEMKVLVNKNDPTKARLLMRREQVFKLCCNMPITKELKFVKMNATAVSFGGQDFSEGEMKTEKLTIKFKTPELIKTFQDAVVDVQKKMGDKPVEVMKKDVGKTEAKGFGDLFKPKVGSWTCEACYISNKPEILYCVACETPKDSTVPKKEAKSILATNDEASKFSFGIPNQSGFSFGMPTATNNTVEAQQKPASSSFSFGSNNGPTTNTGFSFGSKTSEVSSTTNEGSGFKFDPPKPSFSFGNVSSTENATPKIQLNLNPTVQEVGKSDSGFNFIFKKKSPTKSKSPGKSRNDSVGNESEGGATEDENEYHEEEENQTYFTPAIPLPEKINVQTGEESEITLYSHRAKLFRFVDKEWKERGLGDVKILKHNTTNNLRVIMRREQIHKICLNFFLTHDIEFKRKDDQSWSFGANDFSEGEYEPTSFAIRFKNKEICEDFKKVIDDALAGNSKSYVATDEKKSNGDLIKKLMLPENFFDYEKAENCFGCLGCKPDEYIYDSNRKLEFTDNSSPLSLMSPSKIVRYVPRRASQDKKVSFKIAEKKENESIVQISGGKANENNVEKFNTDVISIKKSEATTNIFAKFNQENPASSNIFGSTTQNIFGDGKSAFNNTSSTSLFSSSLNTGIPVTSSNHSNNSKDQASIFGTKTNFGAVSNGTSIFGNANKENNSSFGSTAFSNTPSFGTSIFGSALNTTIASKPAEKPANIFSASSTNSNFSFAEAAKQLEKSNDGEKDSTSEPEFLKNAVSFGGFAELAATSNSNTAFNAQQTAGSAQFFGLTVKDDFFSKNLNKQNTSTDDANPNDGENVNDENYDPHYDPIISLPEEINVSTGEEDEEKVFGERAKLYRYDNTTKEWKERGVGELKLLHHPKNMTYRMLLRREQIYKLVLNQLVTPDTHLSQMGNSPKAFCWVGMNYAEGNSGEVEQLAIRFKNEDLAKNFKTSFDECQSKLYPTQ